MTGRYSPTRSRLRLVAVALAVAAATAAGCTAPGAAGTPSQTSAGSQTSPAGQPDPTGGRPTPPQLSPVADYRAAVTAAVAHHLRVWIETDLVKRWEAGPTWFQAGVHRVAELASLPGVAGIKVADELGYNDGMDSPAMIRQFLSDTARSLHAAAPHAQILVDMVVPELGCLPGHQPAGSGPAICASRARAQYPQLSLPNIDGYLRMHAIDVLDLSTGLLSGPTYAQWGTTADGAQRAAWLEVARRGWPRLVFLQARKALAHPGNYPGAPAQAEADLHTFVDIPLASGAHAVDVWAWHQEYEGAMYRLMNPGMRPNPLWAGLEQRRRDHDVLFTNMSPHSVESGLNQDLAMIAAVFTDVLLPAGTG
jgi:hypothetical protein